MMTPGQMRCFEIIKLAIAETGCSPSYDEIARLMGLKSKNGVNRMVSALEERGFIRRRPNPNRVGHNIEVLRDDLGIDARIKALLPWFKEQRPNDYISAEAAVSVLLKIARE